MSNKVKRKKTKDVSPVRQKERENNARFVAAVQAALKDMYQKQSEMEEAYELLAETTNAILKQLGMPELDEMLDQAREAAEEHAASAWDEDKEGEENGEVPSED